jgi:hypothetical protein
MVRFNKTMEWLRVKTYNGVLILSAMFLGIGYCFAYITIYCVINHYNFSLFGVTMVASIAWGYMLFDNRKEWQDDSFLKFIKGIIKRFKHDK